MFFCITCQFVKLMFSVLEGKKKGRKRKSLCKDSNYWMVMKCNSFPGKLNRGLSVIDSYKLLKEGQELTKEEIFLASALGWCIEWVYGRVNHWLFSWAYWIICVIVELAIFLLAAEWSYSLVHCYCSFKPIFLSLMTLWITLIHDVISLVGLGCPRYVPIMSLSFARSLSFLLPVEQWILLNCILKVGLIAVNDGILLRNHIPRILKKHFRGKAYYVDLLDLFNEVIGLLIFVSVPCDVAIGS